MHAQHDEILASSALVLFAVRADLQEVTEQSDVHLAFEKANARGQSHLVSDSDLQPGFFGHG